MTTTMGSTRPSRHRINLPRCFDDDRMIERFGFGLGAAVDAERAVEMRRCIARQNRNPRLMKGRN